MSNRSVDANGYMTIKGNPITKVGVFPYLGKSIGAPEPNKIYHVYRPEEEINNQATIDSFKGMPWIDDHEMLGAGHTDPEKKGIQGAIGDEVYFESPYLRGNLRAYTKKLQDKIQSGKRDLSPGYRCRYEPSSGVFDGKEYDYIQRDLRGNHLATVTEGRTGKDVCVLDNGEMLSAMDEHCVFSIDFDETGQQMELKDIMDALTGLTDKVSNMQTTIDAMDATAVDKSAKERDDEKADRDDEKEEEEGAEDVEKDKKNSAKDKEKAKDKKKAEDKIKTCDNAEVAMDAKQVQAAIDSAITADRASRAQSASLHDKASQFVGVFDHSDKTPAEVATYIAGKLGVSVTDGAEVPIVEAALAMKIQAGHNTIVSQANDSMDQGSVDVINKYA